MAVTLLKTPIIILGKPFLCDIMIPSIMWDPDSSRSRTCIKLDHQHRYQEPFTCTIGHINLHLFIFNILLLPLLSWLLQLMPLPLPLAPGHRLQQPLSYYCLLQPLSTATCHLPPALGICLYQNPTITAANNNHYFMHLVITNKQCRHAYYLPISIVNSIPIPRRI